MRVKAKTAKARHSSEPSWAVVGCRSWRGRLICLVYIYVPCEVWKGTAASACHSCIAGAQYVLGNLGSCLSALTGNPPVVANPRRHRLLVSSWTFPRTIQHPRTTQHLIGRRKNLCSATVRLPFAGSLGLQLETKDSSRRMMTHPPSKPRSCSVTTAWQPGVKKPYFNRVGVIHSEVRREGDSGARTRDGPLLRHGSVILLEPLARKRYQLGTWKLVCRKASQTMLVFSSKVTLVHVVENTAIAHPCS